MKPRIVVLLIILAVFLVALKPYTPYTIKVDLVNRSELTVFGTWCCDENGNAGVVHVVPYETYTYKAWPGVYDYEFQWCNQTLFYDDVDTTRHVRFVFDECPIQ